jgi:hypothetical protein
VQHFMIFSMISSTHSNWQTIMMQIREQSRQIITLINVVSQLVSFIAKFKRKLIVMFSFNEDFPFTNIQRVSSKRVVKFTKRAQIIRIEVVKIKKAKIHERSIEFLISLNFETTYLVQRDALFVNKHVSSQSDYFDSFINVFSFTNFNFSNQSFSESIVVDARNFFHDFVFVSAFVFVFVFIFGTTFISMHQWLSRNMFLIDNHSITTIIFNIFDTSLSTSFIDFVSTFFNKNLFTQITTIILQKFFERARREARQQVRNVYPYDLVINQIVRSFFSETLLAKSSHLLFYLLTTINIQTSILTIREIKQKRDIDKSRDRSRENDVEREIQRTWIFFSLRSSSAINLETTIISRKLSILQYNVHKFKDLVMTSFLRDSTIKRFDIIAVQESWINVYANITHHSLKNNHFLFYSNSIEIKKNLVWVCIFVIKRIFINDLKYVFRLKDVMIVQIRLHESHYLHLHNVYNESNILSFFVLHNLRFALKSLSNE